MKPLPLSIQGFGVSETTLPIYTLRVEPRGRFDCACELEFTPGTITARLPVESSLAEQTRAVAAALAAFNEAQHDAIAAVLSATDSRWKRLLTIAPTHVKLKLDTAPPSRLRDAIVDKVIALCLTFSAATEAERLAAGAANARSAHDRVHDLRLLLRDHPQSAHTRTALITACADASAHVRLFGATALGREGLPVLRALSLQAAMPQDVREPALRAYLKTVSAAEKKAIVVELARGDRVAQALAFEGALSLQSAAAVPALCALLRHGDEAVRLRVVHALPGYARAIATLEQPLVGCLAAASPELGADIAYFLGEAGTHEAARAINTALKRARHPGYVRVLKAARARLVERLGGAGALSIAADDRGALSKA
jgi:hypothetical protein